MPKNNVFAEKALPLPPHLRKVLYIIGKGKKSLISVSKDNGIYYSAVERLN